MKNKIILSFIFFFGSFVFSGEGPTTKETQNLRDLDFSSPHPLQSLILGEIRKKPKTLEMEGDNELIFKTENNFVCMVGSKKSGLICMSLFVAECIKISSDFNTELMKRCLSEDSPLDPTKCLLSGAYGLKKDIKECEKLFQEGGKKA